MRRIGAAARAAAGRLALTSYDRRSRALTAAAAELRSSAADVLAANAADLDAARERGLSVALLDRLALDEARLDAVAGGLERLAGRDDPLGRVLAKWQQPNGLWIERIAVPLGVIGIIYESRPNVTADAAALCVLAGNAAILRGGSESYRSNQAIHACLERGLTAAGIDADAVQVVPTTDRAAVGELLGGLDGTVDVVVPRGGRSLVARVQAEARVPVIGHLEGLCHVYLHEAAAPEMAVAIVANAKMRRTGICGAAETLLVDAAAAARLLPPVAAQLIELGCELRGDAAARAIVADMREASDEDWRTEYLDAILAIRVVDGVDAAIEHIGAWGSGHTDCIVTDDAAAATEFLRRVDSAIVLHNASTQFADGGEFGMGAEIGIATGRIHARGPVGAEQLTSYKYVVRGSGQVRQ